MISRPYRPSRDVAEYHASFAGRDAAVRRMAPPPQEILVPRERRDGGDHGAAGNPGLQDVRLLQRQVSGVGHKPLPCVTNGPALVECALGCDEGRDPFQDRDPAAQGLLEVGSDDGELIFDPFAFPRRNLPLEGRRGWTPDDEGKQRRDHGGQGEWPEPDAWGMGSLFAHAKLSTEISFGHARARGNVPPPTRAHTRKSTWTTIIHPKRGRQRIPRGNSGRTRAKRYAPLRPTGLTRLWPAIPCRPYRVCPPRPR